MRSIPIILVLIVCSAQAWAQHPLVIEGEATPPDIGIDERFGSDLERRNALEELVEASWKKGYLAASIDSTRRKGDTLFARFHRGKLYEWGSLSVGERGKGMVKDAGVDLRGLEGERIDPVKLSELFEKVLEHCERNGYPFARVRFDSIRREEEGLKARFELDKGPLIRLDSVIIKGEDAVHRSFLTRYLGLEQEMVYDEQRIERIDERMRSLPFLNPSKPSELLFREEAVSIYLYPEEKEASRFNGMVGLQPDEEEGGVVLTGDLTLSLRNALNRGEGISLDWDRMQVGTQDLSVGYDHPYLFKTPFGIDLGLKLYRKDSSFTELKQRVAIQYLFSGADHFQVHYKRKKWTLLKGGERSREADLAFANLEIDAYGIGIRKADLDRRYLPREGIRTEFEGSVGRKELSGSPPSFLEGKADIDSSGKSLQYEFQASLEGFYPLLPRLILMGGFEGGLLEAPYFVENELYRIGGHGSLRGVNKESIRASTYGIGTFELRYLLEAESDLHLFFDGAYHENRSGEGLSVDRPFGFGLGTRFKTKAGIFELDYALGRRFDNPIRLREGRVHFGFTSLF